jgi:hypothetical protein
MLYDNDIRRQLCREHAEELAKELQRARAPGKADSRLIDLAVKPWSLAKRLRRRWISHSPAYRAH